MNKNKVIEKKSRFYQFVILVFLISFFLPNCTFTNKTQQIDLVWPLPPDLPRIRFIRAFSFAEELNIKQPWYKKLHAAFTGKKNETIRIKDPYGIWVDGKETIYVTDSSLKAILEFNQKDGQFKPISLPGQRSFHSPISVFGENKNRIYISDSALGEVLVFGKNRNFLFNIDSSHFQRPTGIVVNTKENKLYVVDTLSHCIKTFSLEGEFLYSFGRRGSSPGEFNFPTCISCDSQGRLYIGDSMNFRIQIFDSHGDFLSTFGQLGDGTGYFSQIKGVATDSEGHIYVTDAQFDLIQVFDDQGNYLMNFGGPGTEPGQFQFPAGIFIDKNDRIYVVDRLNHRVQIFEYIKENNADR